jgi:hypothetical protein
MSVGLNLPAGTITIEVIDSHTGGEPTRVVTGGFPPLRGATLGERGADLAGRHRRLATAIVDEPRGNDPMVGALLTEPQDTRCVTGAIFFDRTMVLGMCGHGMIGLVETLRRLGRIGAGKHLVETPVGVVSAMLGTDGRVSVDNVVSRRIEHGIAVDVPSLGRVTGDIVYGGNMFFLVGAPTIDLDRPRADGELAQLRAVPERHVRPLPVRHRHERQGRRAGGRWAPRRGRNVGAGVDHRVPVRRALPVARPRRRGDHPDRHRVGGRHGTRSPAHRTCRIFLTAGAVVPTFARLQTRDRDRGVPWRPGRTAQASSR